jgi:hypothetical protein
MRPKTRASRPSASSRAATWSRLSGAKLAFSTAVAASDVADLLDVLAFEVVQALLGSGSR